MIAANPDNKVAASPKTDAGRLLILILLQFLSPKIPKILLMI